MGRRGPQAGPKAADVEFEPVPWEEPGLSRYERVVAFLEWLPVTKGKLQGQKMALLDFQRDFLLGVYGEGDGAVQPIEKGSLVIYQDRRPVTLGVQSVPRGNGKTGLLAGLCLCHLVGPECEPRGEVFSAAIDREQASIIFAEMEAIIYAVPRFNAAINVQRFHKKLEVKFGPGAGSTYASLSRDARRGHGLAPSFWVYDELAQAPDGELLDNLITAMGKRKESLGVVISTQAPNDQHPLSELIDDADDSTFVQLICAPIEADPFSEETIRACNPALDHFLDAADLLKQADRASRLISFEPRFRNLRLNQRISQEANFVSQIIWNANGKEPLEDAFAGGMVYAGLDLSARNDLTALVYMAREEGIWHVRSEFFAPKEGIADRAIRDRVPYEIWWKRGLLTATDGASVDYRVIAERLIDLCDTYDVAAIAFDRWRIDVLQRELERIGIELPLVPFGQGYKDMAPALDSLEAELNNERIRHGNHPILKWNATNAIIDTDPAGNRKLNKAKSTARIDGMVAFAMAIGQAEKQEEPQNASGGFVCA